MAAKIPCLESIGRQAKRRHEKRLQPYTHSHRYQTTVTIIDNQTTMQILYRCNASKSCFSKALFFPQPCSSVYFYETLPCKNRAEGYSIPSGIIGRTSGSEHGQSDLPPGSQMNFAQYAHLFLQLASAAAVVRCSTCCPKWECI